MKTIKRLTALLLCAVMMLCCTGCEEEEVSPENKFFTYNLSKEPDNLDPQSASGEDAWTVIQNLYEGLCRVDATGHAIPGAAERWEHNADYTQFTFYLRDGVCWNTEEPVVMQDFVFAIRRALDPKTGCPMADELFCIQGAQAYYEGTGSWSDVGVKAVTSTVLEITLTEPFEDFPAETAKSAYMPCDEIFFYSTGGRYGKEDDMMITNGPFALRSYSGWMYNDYIRLVRSKTYRGAETVWPTGIMFDIGSSKDPIKDLTEGAINAAKLDAAQAARAEQAGLQVISFAESTYGIVINCQDEYMQSPSTRLAFLTALTRDNFSGTYPSGTRPASGIIPEAVSIGGEAFRQWAGVCPDASSARSPEQLLDQGLKETGHSKLTGSLTVLCVDTQENRLIVNQMLAAWRNQLGYYFNIETVSSESALKSRIQQGKYRIALMNVSPTENSVTDMTDQIAAMAGYESADYDRLMGQIRQEPLETAKALERLLVDDGVFYPLYTTSSMYAQGETVTGLIIRPFGGGLDFRRAGRT